MTCFEVKLTGVWERQGLRGPVRITFMDFFARTPKEAETAALNWLGNVSKCSRQRYSDLKVLRVVPKDVYPEEFFYVEVV